MGPLHGTTFSALRRHGQKPRTNVSCFSLGTPLFLHIRHFNLFFPHPHPRSLSCLPKPSLLDYRPDTLRRTSSNTECSFSNVSEASAAVFRTIVALPAGPPIKFARSCRAGLCFPPAKLRIPLKNRSSTTRKPAVFGYPQRRNRELRGTRNTQDTKTHCDTVLYRDLSKATLRAPQLPPDLNIHNGLEGSSGPASTLPPGGGLN